MVCSKESGLLVKKIEQLPEPLIKLILSFCKYDKPILNDSDVFYTAHGKIFL